MYDQPCSCIREVYDFYVDNRGCGRMVYQDMSEWNDEPPYKRPDDYIVEILAPGCASPVSLKLRVNGPTLITSKDLGLGDGCLPDGIYSFATVSCRSRYTKFVSWACFLECRVACLKADERNHKEKEAIAEIELFIEASKIKAEDDEPIEADKYYRMARDLIDIFECDCKCC